MSVLDKDRSLPAEPDGPSSATATGPAKTWKSHFTGRVTSDGYRVIWWVEILMCGAFYFVYSFIRNANQGSTADALHNAERLIRLQERLGIFREPTLQRWALHFTPLVVALNYFYGSLHFIATAGVLVFLYRRHTDRYPFWRNTLAVTTALALIGFVTWPLMPPRLLPESLGFHFVDTLDRYPTFWSFKSGAVANVSNQYAAMPSLHMAWSTWVALAAAPLVERRWKAVLLWCYPLVTLTAILLTANHYLLDAVGGLTILTSGYLTARVITRAGRRAPRVVAGEVAPAAGSA